jgi:hypothetical protein
MSAAGLSANGQNITISAPGAGTYIDLAYAALSVQGQVLVVVPGEVSIGLDNATLQALGQNVVVYTPWITFTIGIVYGPSFIGGVKSPCYAGLIFGPDYIGDIRGPDYEGAIIGPDYEGVLR